MHKKTHFSSIYSYRRDLSLSNLLFKLASLIYIVHTYKYSTWFNQAGGGIPTFKHTTKFHSKHYILFFSFDKYCPETWVFGVFFFNLFWILSKIVLEQYQNMYIKTCIAIEKLKVHKYLCMDSMPNFVNIFSWNCL